MTQRICSENGCDTPHVARGFCQIHYIAARRNGMEALPPTGHQLKAVDRERMVADCAACGPEVPIGVFGGKKRAKCLVRHQLDRERINRRRKAESEEQKARRLAYHREYARAAKYQLKRSLGIEALLDRAGWACEICEGPLTVKSARIDHDHACCPGINLGPTCGLCVRGVLCNRCNTALGLFRDNADILYTASVYVTTKTARLPAA